MHKGNGTIPPSMLETERLVLRPLSPDDLAQMHTVFDDPKVRRYLFDNEPVSAETARALLEQNLRDFSEGGVGLFGICLSGNQRLIGFCGFFEVEGVGEPEMTYGLLPEHWGRGLATEAALAVARFAFEEANFERVLVGTEPANVASMRVIERLETEPLGETIPAAPEVVYFVLNRQESRSVPTIERKQK